MKVATQSDQYAILRTAAIPLSFNHDDSGNLGHSIQAVHARTGTPVGVMHLYGNGQGNHPAGEIYNMAVDKRYRKQGIGRAMVEHAKSLGLQPLHSSSLLQDGESFADHVPLPHVWHMGDDTKIVPHEVGRQSKHNFIIRNPETGTTRYDAQGARALFNSVPEWKPGQHTAAASPPVHLYRGVSFSNQGRTTPELVEHLHAHPEDAANRLWSEQGRHWTTNPEVAHHFALGRMANGFRPSSRQNDSPHDHGVVLHALVHPDDIIDHDSEEGQWAAKQHWIAPPTSEEAERTVRHDTALDIQDAHYVSGRYPSQVSRSTPIPTHLVEGLRT